MMLLNSVCFYDRGQVLPGYVTSVEDHGFLVSFGVEGSQGFLPKKGITSGRFVFVHIT